MAADAPIRVVVGEDQSLVREGIVRVLEEAGFEVVGVAGEAADLVRKARAHKPDVIVTDIQMPPDSTDDGLRAALEIRAEQPDVGVVVLSQFLEDRYALDLVGDRAGRAEARANAARRPHAPRTRGHGTDGRGAIEPGNRG
jgi:DNA-binding NarL/FixJ family response regulator